MKNRRKPPTSHAFWEAQSFGEKCSRKSTGRPRVNWQSNYSLQSRGNRPHGWSWWNADSDQTVQTNWNNTSQTEAGHSRSSERECTLPCPSSTHKGPSSPPKQEVRVSETRLETPWKTCQEGWHVWRNHKHRAVLATPGLLQSSSRDEDEGSERGERNVKAGGIY